MKWREKLTVPRIAQVELMEQLSENIFLIQAISHYTDNFIMNFYYEFLFFLCVFFNRSAIQLFPFIIIQLIDAVTYHTRSQGYVYIP